MAKHISYSLGPGGHGLYYRGIQVPETACLGWLLFSTNEMNKQELARQLSEFVGTQVDLRWRVIYTGSGFKREASSDGPVKALHLEVAADDAKAAKALLRKMYGTVPDPDCLPVLGLRFCLCPEITRLTSLASIASRKLFVNMWCVLPHGRSRSWTIPIPFLDVHFARFSWLSGPPSRVLNTCAFSSRSNNVIGCKTGGLCYSLFLISNMRLV